MWATLNSHPQTISHSHPRTLGGGGALNPILNTGTESQGLPDFKGFLGTCNLTLGDGHGDGRRRSLMCVRRGTIGVRERERVLTSFLPFLTNGRYIYIYTKPIYIAPFFVWPAYGYV